ETLPPNQSSELLLKEEIQANDAILIPVDHRRPLRIQRPLRAYNLRVRIIQRSHISERELGRDLLLQREPRLRKIGSTRECRVDLQLVNTEHSLQPVRKRIRDRLAQQRRFTHLLEALGGRGRLISKYRWVRCRCFSGR